MTAAKPRPSVAPSRPGALRTWIGKADDRYPFPEYTPLDECQVCSALVLTSKLDSHMAYHRRMAHL